MKRVGTLLMVAAFALSAACVFEDSDVSCFDTGDGVKCVESEVGEGDAVDPDVVPYILSEELSDPSPASAPSEPSYSEPSEPSYSEPSEPSYSEPSEPSYDDER